jgi:ribosomal protein S18 acetylase RimI-like enzyme
MNPVSCGVFRTPDTAEAVELLAREFSAADPPAVAMELTQADMAAFVSRLCPAAAADGLTIVARLPESDRIAGVLLTDDFGAPPPLDLSGVTDRILPILAMLDGLDEAYRTGRSIAPGRYLHLFMLAVDARFARRGIAQQLVAACLANGRAKGYTHAVTEATGVVSQHVFRKSGFHERQRAAYRDYRHDGRAVFASIRGHDATILMDRPLA